MNKVIVAALCAVLFASLSPAREARRQATPNFSKYAPVTDADARRELTGRSGFRRVTAQLDTTVLLDHPFDQGIVHCDAMGWTSNDDTQQLDNYWHVDDFDGLSGVDGGLVPLEGNQSMWCGTRADAKDPVKCAYVELPGYANNWDQWFQTGQCLAVTGDVNFSFQIYWDTEPDFDFVHVQWDGCDGNWQDLVVNGHGALDGLGQWDTTLTVPAAMHSGNVRFRFLVRSDGATSDGDGEINTDGACTVDELL
ncbi:MAG: hypothetical protein PVF33_02910, partial [Candidatus Latescibacterota bacterium]